MTLTNLLSCFKSKPLPQVRNDLTHERLKRCVEELRSEVKENDILRVQLSIAIDALQYCSMRPKSMKAESALQYVVAGKALSEIAGMIED